MMTSMNRMMTERGFDSTLVVTSAAVLRRVWLTLVLSVVLSAVELERPLRVIEPPAVVLIAGEPPRHDRRTRPYRAHHRRMHSTQMHVR